MTEPDPEESQATCLVCQPPVVVGSGILDHLRLFHPEQYGDGPARWPDGGFVVVDLTAETPEDVLRDWEPGEEPQ